MLQIFVALKNRSPLAGFEPANLTSNGKHGNHYITEGDDEVVCMLMHKAKADV
jgi:hypothetical protein